MKLTQFNNNLEKNVTKIKFLGPYEISFHENFSQIPGFLL